MSVAEFIGDLTRSGIHLRLENGQLRFKARKGAMTPAIKTQIIGRKPELLTFLERREQINGHIPAAPKDRPIPLSLSQQWIWLFEQINGMSSAYNMPYATEIRGQFDVAALQVALNKINARHAILRTTFAMQGGVATQIVHPPKPIPILQRDLRGSADSWQDAVIEESLVPFDIERDTLWRVCLFTLAEEHYVLTLTMHHILGDGWSSALFVRELVTLYLDPAAELPPQPISYGDYAVWQRNFLSGKTLDDLLAYWTTQLADVPPLLTLPTDKPRPNKQSHRGDEVFFTLSAELTTQLNQLCQRNGATLFMVLEAALAVLLSRYAGQEDVIIATPIANRPKPELENMLGCFVNILAIRNDLSGEPTFADLLQRVRQTTLDAYAHQALPFEMLVEKLQPERTLSYNPLFQAMLTMMNTPDAVVDLPGLTMTRSDMSFPISKIDVTAKLYERDGKIAGWWEYNTDIFERETAERMVQHFEQLLWSIVANPDAPIDQLSLLTSAEKHQLLVTWNDTAVDYPLDKPFVQLFAAQAAHTPHAPAARFERDCLTYDQLNRRANQLAHYLIEQGVQKGCWVGIQVERSLNMLVAMLGIGKSGGSYVPLDPTYPPERLAYMREDAQMVLILNDETWPELANYPDDAPPVTIHPDDLAYMIYTSGSTGRPKGVQIKQRGLTNLLHTMRDKLRVTAADTVLAITTISFDMSVPEPYLPLLAGGTALIVDKETARDGHRFARLLEAGNIDVMQATPATYRMLLTAGWQGSPKLRAVCGGEAMPSDLAEALLAKCGELWNFYGPTETTVWSTAVRVTPELAKRQIVTIGRPLANTELYILDKHKQPAPVGVLGELYIGGTGVARGYLNRPELTAERFVSKDELGRMKDEEDRSFILHPSSFILYKTGDLCRYLPDGNIEFFGRADHQIKLRGFRIELGEIEAALEDYPAVRQTAVILRDERLVAYYVTDDPSSFPQQKVALHNSSLQTHLAAKLPDYMIPSIFIQLDTMPMTPSNKVNRRALPAPQHADLDTEQFVGPRDATEQQLVQIWQKVLQLPRIGVRDNFFAIGGHSLLAVRMVAQIQETFDRQLAIATLFENPTIEQLALILRDETVTWSSLVAIQPHGDKTPLFCVPGAGGNVIYFYDLAQTLGAEQPLYGLQAVGLDGKTPPHESIEEMATHYVNEIRRVQPHGPYYLGGHSIGGRVVFEMAQQLLAAGESVGQLFIFDIDAPSDKSQLSDPWDDARYLVELGVGLSETTGVEIDIPYEDVRGLTLSEQIGYLRGAMERAGVEVVSAEFAQLRALFELFKRHNNLVYIPTDPQPVPITLFRATDRAEIISSWWPGDPTLGWHQYALGDVQIHTVTGSHASMLTQPHVEQVVALLAAKLG